MLTVFHTLISFGLFTLHKGIPLPRKQKQPETAHPFNVNHFIGRGSDLCKWGQTCKIAAAEDLGQVDIL